VRTPLHVPLYASAVRSCVAHYRTVLTPVRPCATFTAPGLPRFTTSLLRGITRLLRGISLPRRSTVPHCIVAHVDPPSLVRTQPTFYLYRRTFRLQTRTSTTHTMQLPDFTALAFTVYFLSLRFTGFHGFVYDVRLNHRIPRYVHWTPQRATRALYIALPMTFLHGVTLLPFPHPFLPLFHISPTINACTARWTHYLPPSSNIQRARSAVALPCPCARTTAWFTRFEQHLPGLLL